MDNTFDEEIPREEKAEISRQIALYLEKMRRIQEEMTKDREEIDQLKAETRAMLDRLRKVA